MKTANMNLLGKSLSELESFVQEIGEERFRAQQLFKWMYDKGASSFDEMTNLSKELREKLNQTAEIRTLQLVTSRTSGKDRSEKHLFQLRDGQQIETVLMFEGKRTTLCLSTQVGCAIDCKFCATGLMGLQRNLDPGEIVEQLLAVQRTAKVKVSNVVFMGMGEPFHNYDNVIRACELLCDPAGQNLSRQRIVVSTSGLVPKMLRFADEGHKYRLAVSLNATTDRIRTQIMPLNKKWPLSELLNAAKYYVRKSDQRITFEYVLLAGVNDSDEDAARLRQLTHDIHCKINLIPYNATIGTYRRPNQERISAFYERMLSLSAPVTIRWSKGDDINAACGQLVTKVRRQSEDLVEESV